eukprot:2860293-Rhodomonas_salina.1
MYVRILGGRARRLAWGWLLVEDERCRLVIQIAHILALDFLAGDVGDIVHVGRKVLKALTAHHTAWDGIHDRENVSDQLRAGAGALAD